MQVSIIIIDKSGPLNSHDQVASRLGGDTELECG